MSSQAKEDNEADHRKLDALALRSLDLVESLLTERRSLELVMRQGFLQMAKARYTMGKNTVSTVQLPSENNAEFTAMAKVKTSVTEDEIVAKTEFTLCTDSDDALDDHIKDKLRQRTGADVIKERAAKDPPEAKFQRDPLHWFGILVPQNLRTCQRHFKEVVAMTCRIATYQNELEAVRKEYKRLADIVAKSSNA